MTRLGMAAFTVALAAILIMPSQTMGASAMTKAQYISLWSSACIANGRSRSLKLTSYESSTASMMVDPFLRAYRASLTAMNMRPKPLSQMKREACGCIATYVAGHKRSLAAPTPNAVVDRAVDKCLLN